MRDLLRHPAGGNLHLLYDRDGERMTVEAEVRPREGYVRLSHPTRARNGPAHLHYTVHLVTTEVGFGGRRQWFACPLAGRRCSTLYLPRGGQVFASVGAGAYRLAYGVTRIDPAERSWWRMARIARRLGDDAPELHRPPAKPKWMRWRTYERLLDAWLQTREDPPGGPRRPRPPLPGPLQRRRLIPTKVELRG